MPNSNCPTPTSQPAGLAKCAREARQGKGWSQIELSRQSRVSTRTIVDIERGNQLKPRQEVVVRLARALGQDPAVWLRLAGHGNITADKLERMVRDSGGFRFHGEIDPGEFFDALGKCITPKQPALICVAYPSIPGTIHRSDVQRTLIELFSRGLWVAMVCPYPRIGEIETAKRPSLVRHYSEVFGHVVELARELRSKLPLERKKQLQVFVPRPAKTVYYVMPLAGLAEYRPTLVKYYADEEANQVEFELSAWVTLLQERRDRWIQIYPAQDEPEGEARFQKFLCWRDYFSDILSKCDPPKDRGWKREDFRDADWELVDLEPRE